MNIEIVKNVGNRGQLTDYLQRMAINFLKREISVKELRLYPYIDYCIKNGGRLDYSKMTAEERDILTDLMEEKHIIFSPEKIVCTKEFYDYMQNMLFYSYVENRLVIPYEKAVM